MTQKNEWKDNGTEFFLPIQIISKVFRGKYMEELKNLWETGQLKFHGTAEKYRNHYAFKELLKERLLPVGFAFSLKIGIINFNSHRS